MQMTSPPGATTQSEHFDTLELIRRRHYPVLSERHVVRWESQFWRLNGGLIHIFFENLFDEDGYLLHLPAPPPDEWILPSTK